MKTKSLIIFFLLFALTLNASDKQYPEINFLLASGTDMMVSPGITNKIFGAQYPGITQNNIAQLNSPDISTSIQNTIILVLKNHSALDVDAKVTVTASVNFFLIDGTSEKKNIKLAVDSKKGKNQKSKISSVYAYTNAYQIELKITNVTVEGDSKAELKEKLENFIELNATFQKEQITRIDYNSVVTGLTACEDTKTDELVINWNHVEGAEKYEVEYTYVDDYSDNYSAPLSQNQISYNFKDNSTRISLKETYYRFPLLFERGYILYRVRVIGRGGNNLQQPVYCKWSGGNEKGVVSSYSPYIYHHKSAHMQDKINWQVSSTFSEDGKRSDIVNYFDGTFRSRQTVTGVNLEKQEYISIPSFSNLSCLPGSDKIHEVIAGETKYDFQGRPTVNILPIPTNSLKIKYLPLLNRLENTNQSYNWQDFDKPGYNCLLSRKLDAGIYTNGIMGSSGYYSPNNPNKLGFNAFIPDAGGYPFTQVSYLQDNTGRISTQSGVGETFRLGNGQETRYFYATPNAKELYKMFGTEVGDAIRYKKDAVIDPNGQVAVTYMNPEGKVIATCLAGDGPENLEQLENKNENTITVSLLDKNLINTDDKTIITEHSFFVGYPCEYTFEYSITPQTLDALLCDNAEVCLDCIYDIVITLNHNEKCTSTPLFEYSGTIGELIAENIYPDLKCFNNSSTGNYPRQKTETLDIGTYVITKKITVNKQAALKYVEEIYKEKCESKWNEILKDELSRIDTMDCYSSCLDCQQPPVPTQDCDTSYCKPNPNRCEVIRDMMLSDISPGGQYAQFDRDANGEVNSTDPLSIFNKANILPNNNLQIFSNPLLSQYNITDYTSMVNNWRPEFAEILLPFHPEYCMLGWCDSPDITATLDFDVQILSTHNYSDAISKGYINPSSGDISLQLLNADPWFNQMNVNEKTILKANLLKYGCDPTEEIEKLAMAMAYCYINKSPEYNPEITPEISDPPSSDCTLPPNYLNERNFGYASTELEAKLADAEWTFLRALYLSAKNKVLQLSMDGYAINNQCDTKCIGSSKWWWWCFQGNFNFVNYNSPPCNEHWACFYYSDKQIRFGSETRSSFQAMDDAGISIDFSGINVNDPCQITEAIQNQSGSINQQFASIYCGDIISAPCEISNTLTLLINTMISQLKDSLSAYTYVTISGEQLPLSIRNAGIGAISVSITEQRLMTITLRPCTDPIEIPFLQTETGLVRPVSISISNIVCPNNANCRFDLKVTYANNLRTTKDLHIQTECDYLKDCVNSTSGICTQTTVHAKAVRDYLNSIFRFIITYNTPPSSPQLLNLLPSILKEKNGKPAINISLNYSSDFIITIIYGKDDSETDTCTIVLRSNSNITNWFDIKNIINITPDYASAQNNLTKSFNLNVISGNDIDNFSKYIINGISSCWNMNQCPPEVNFCDIKPEFPSVPPINDCVNNILSTAYGNTNIRYQQWIDSVKNDLLQRYYEKCLTAAEIFNMTYDDKQYHYTLYYYDQAGNLVKTIPPTGVKLLNDDQTQQIADDRETGNNITLLPDHIKPTLYRYNTLNQVTWQKTPDAGQSNFYYDGLGRIVTSQNAQQNQDGFYSYTKYDKLGRIFESGKVQATDINSDITRDWEDWETFIGLKKRSEITYTQYDKHFLNSINQKFGSSGQRNLRNRVSSVLKFRRGENLLNKKYSHSTHYTYDIQGNVYKLIQDYPNDIIGDKTIEYRYDLQSGKVNELIYQRGAPDQFMHKYSYDASNRLIRAETSLNGLIWETDAEYFYYRHGPLARMELGTDKVQGLDYMYTLQGWIKGVNGTTLSAETDMGQDGIINPPDETGHQTVPGTITINGQTYNLYDLSQLVGNNFNGPGYGALHNPIARDAFGYVLDYFIKDYIPINGNSCLNALQQKVGSVNSLFNGNIARMYTQIQELGNTGFNYKYDQLNRLITQKGWKLENNNMQSIGNAYSVKLKYDADGNILTLRRNGTFDKPKMDNLHYNYYTQNGAIYNPEILIPPDATNKLSFVNDYIPDGEYTEDIDKQGPGNYNYNLIGNLISDNKGNIEHIHWNLQNKVIKIDKLNGPGIGFEYDALGNRIMKLVGGSEENITFYVRDAQGNILTTYSYKVHENEGNTPLLYWDEAHLYGSSRIGLYKPEIKIPEGKIGIENDRRSPEEAGIIMFNKNLFGNIIYNINLSKKEYLSKRPTEPYYSETRGYKQYELTNHLGNVLATITDRKLPVINNGTVELYTADIKSGQDYYPGGMLQQDRSFSANSYRYGYQGSEKDDEITGVTGANFTTLFREGDTRTLRWWSTDPKANEQPWQSPYSYMDGNPIWFNDPQGDDLWKSEVDDEGNVNYIAEKRDTKKSFSEQYGLSLKETKEIFSRSGYFDKGKGIEESLVGEGNKIKISGESVKKSTGSEILKLDLSSTLATSQRKFDQLIFAMDYSKVSGKESFNPLDYFSKKSALVNPWTGVGGLTGKNVKIRIDNTNYEVSYFDADIYWNNPIQNRPNSISPDIPLRGETYHNIKFKHATGNQLKIYIQTPSYNTGRVNDRLNR